MKRFSQMPPAAGHLSRRLGAAGCWRRRAGRALLLAGIVLAGLCRFAVPAVRAAESAPLDFQVKAAFLVNFPKYVDWPAATLPDTNSPIKVAIFGDENVAGEFARMIEGGRTVGGRSIALQRVTDEDQIGADCRILFIAASQRQRAPAILERIKGLTILTVGESDDFLDQGGVINLVHRDRKIRLQVNLTAAEQAQLKISTRLLIAADTVKGKPE